MSLININISKQYGNDRTLRHLTSVGLILSLVVGVPMPLSAQTATDYIRQKSWNIIEDPLIHAFKETLVASKGGHWKRASSVVSDISPALEYYSEKFGIDLRKVLETAVAGQNAHNTIKIFAHVIFLALRDNLHAAVKARENYSQALAYLETARAYYDRILMGNIKRKSPDVHREIKRLFKNARKALETPGRSGAGKFSSDTGLLVSSAQGIKNNIEIVYTYFNRR